MEAANVLLVPGLALIFGFPRSLIEVVAIAFAAVATAGFLIVGAVYWRGVDRRLRFNDRASTERALAVAHRVEWPLLVITVGAGAATAAALVSLGWSRTVIAAALLTVLAALEYINYYHWQLQHFDNRADFRRLLAGEGMKRSHMARELAKVRAAKSARERIPD